MRHLCRVTTPNLSPFLGEDTPALCISYTLHGKLLEGSAACYKFLLEYLRIFVDEPLCLVMF
jgi:hypothetical protein